MSFPTHSRSSKRVSSASRVPGNTKGGRVRSSNHSGRDVPASSVSSSSSSSSSPPPTDSRVSAEMHALSPDVLQLVFSCLNWRELAVCSSVCTSWRNVPKLRFWIHLYYLTFAPKAISRVLDSYKLSLSKEESIMMKEEFLLKLLFREKLSANWKWRQIRSQHELYGDNWKPSAFADGKFRIQVFCRLKPLFVVKQAEEEKKNSTKRRDAIRLRSYDHRSVTLELPSTAAESGGKSKEKKYVFQRVFRDEDTQKQVYNQCARSLVSDLVSGLDGCLFCYGQTGTGKTHTMLGPPVVDDGSVALGNEDGDLQSPVRLKLALRPPGPDGKLSVLTAGSMDFSSSTEMEEMHTSTIDRKHHRWSSLHSYSEADMGIIPRCCEQLFQLKAFEATVSHFDISVTYVEIYQGVVSDLLNQGKSLSLKLATDEVDAGVFKLAGATVKSIRDMQDVFRLLARADAQKKVFATAMNERSSRSHCIFSIHLKQTEKKLQNRSSSSAISIQSTLHLADLAGSERVKTTKVTGQRLSEARAINKSLTALQRCIMCLRENTPYVPFRDSTITKILQKALGGNSRTCLLITGALEQEHLLETAAAMRFGERVMSIRNDGGNNETSVVARSVDVKSSAEELVQGQKKAPMSPVSSRAVTASPTSNLSLQERFDASPYELFSSMQEQLVVQRKRLTDLNKRHQSYARILIAFQGLLQQRDTVGASLLGAFAIFTKRMEAFAAVAENRFERPVEPKWLSVETRLAIALGVCSQILAIHTRDNVPHNSIVPSNVLLLPKKRPGSGKRASLERKQPLEHISSSSSSSRENNAFALYDANLFVQLVRDSELAGRVINPMHRAPEALEGRATLLSDVYSFGVLLLVLWQRGRGKKLKLSEKEMRKLFEKYMDKSKYPQKRVNLFDVRMVTDRSKNTKEHVFHLSSSVPQPIAELIEKCCRLNPSARPSLRKVLDELKNIRQRYNNHHGS